MMYNDDRKALLNKEKMNLQKQKALVKSTQKILQTEFHRNSSELKSLKDKQDAIVSENNKQKENLEKLKFDKFKFKQKIKKALKSLLKVFVILTLIFFISIYIFPYYFLHVIGKIALTIYVIYAIYLIINVMCIVNKNKKIKNLSDKIESLNSTLSTIDTKECNDRNDYLQAELKKSNYELTSIDINIGSIESSLIDISSFNDNVSNFNNHSFPISNPSILDYIFINKDNNDYRGQYLSLKTLFERLAKYTNSYARKEIITDTEKEFLKKLIAISESNNMYVQTNVRLSDIIGLGGFTNMNYSVEWKERAKVEYLNAINTKHIDYVLLDRKNFNVLLCIELDDSSHYDFNNDNYERKHINSHIAKDIILSYCKIPFLRIDVQKAEQISKSELIITLKKALHTKQVFYDYTKENFDKFNSSLTKM